MKMNMALFARREQANKLLRTARPRCVGCRSVCTLCWVGAPTQNKGALTRAIVWDADVFGDTGADKGGDEQKHGASGTVSGYARMGRQLCRGRSRFPSRSNHRGSRGCDFPETHGAGETWTLITGGAHITLLHATSFVHQIPLGNLLLPRLNHTCMRL